MAKNSMPLGWHEECLRNYRRSVADKESGVTRAQRELERSRDDLAFYERQMTEAKAAGMDAFDRDRYLVPRPRKALTA